MKNWKFTAIDIQIISAGMMCQNIEQKLRRDMSEGARTVLKNQLQAYRRKYMDLIHKARYDDEYERYQERQYDMSREERIEQHYNDMWIEAYDEYQDRMLEEELEEELD